MYYKKHDINLEELLTSGKLLEERTCMYDVDPLKAFQKLSAKQFSDPLDAIRELIANAIDSYSLRRKRKCRVDCHVSPEGFSITDYGAGMDDEGLQALRTLGLSTKKGQDLIGRFGIGFASLFHKDLYAETIIVDTQHTAHKQFVFTIEDPGKKISLEEYLLSERAPHGTSIAVSFRKDRQRALKESICTKIKEVGKYLPFAVTLNGEEIPQLPDYGRSRYKRVVNINKNGTRGFLALTEWSDPRITILSRNLPTTDVKLTEVISLDCNDYQGSITGVVNCNKLNLVSSRNDVIKDNQWWKFVAIMREGAQQFLLGFVEEYEKEPTPERRMHLLKMINSITDFYFLNEYKQDEQAFQEQYKDNPLIKHLINVPLFQFWNDPGVYSMADVKRIWRSQQEVFLMTNDEGDLDHLLEQEYSGKVFKSSFRESFNDERTLVRLYNGSFDAESIEGLEQNPGLQSQLVEKGILKSLIQPRLYEIVPEAELDDNTKEFIKELQRVVDSKPVQNLLRRNKIDDDITITASRINQQNVTACYSNGVILLNLNSNEMQPYLQGEPVQAVKVFLPILGHEISHNKVHSHGNPFYNFKNILTLGLREIVARELIQRDVPLIDRIKHSVRHYFDD